MEKVLLWHEVLLICFIFLFIPLLLSSSGTILLIRYKINPAIKGWHRFHVMCGLFLLHFFLSFALTLFLTFGLDKFIFETLLSSKPYGRSLFILQLVYCAVAETITVPSFYYIYKLFINKHVKRTKKLTFP